MNITMSARLRHRLLVAPALLGLALAAACSNSSSGGGNSASSVPTLPAACAKYQPYAGHAGTKVTMFASILSPESDSLEKSWAEFSSCTGIKISYEGSNDFESQLPVRVSGGNLPDLAIIPQPGLLAQMVKTGKVVKPPAQTVANEDQWSPIWKTYGSVNGTFYAAPMSANMKSLVWYSPKAFQQAGYAVPKTWADLMSLSDKIAKAGTNGSKPWCGGIGSGTATGWPATDWLEEVVLGSQGGDVYDQWVSHKVKFSDPAIINSMQTVANWMQNPAWVNGGIGDVKSIATTTFQDAGAPILTGKCWMLQQASFYEAQWPQGTKVAPDGDVYAFELPPTTASIPRPVEGGGEFVTAFSSRPEVQAVQNYLSTADWATSRVKVAPGWVSANRGVDKSLYTDPIDKLSADALTDPTATFRFDASDMMPAAVGSGKEWTAFTAWFAEGEPIKQVASEIDAAWPQ
ncbi:ABC transporter substrate-binding protein [Kitasatospora kifunensis]|uniref:Alpha-glucoside transport system substrate-binding protein n=1 Tax=Kitasatospora kifunensis TaxID=58351 RepID=A0A7W7R5K4_KITKI|nr:ABC transporter substrate-binding protein [Kitasatospora kifunensis]MBB4925654.1 alpha-glucoside transport system substrate-binding protein [Kitasatospora kifunensis]